MAACINASKLKLVDCYLVKNTKLRRRRKRRKNYLKVVDKYFTKIAKALIVSKLIAIFYAGYGKS